MPKGVVVHTLRCWLNRFGLVFTLALLGLGVPCNSYGQECGSPLRGTVLLGFGVRYADATHRGIDLEGRTGDEVAAPLGATVAFAGMVPADGGGTCGAVTLSLSDGSRLSLLPLDRIDVRAGDIVEEAGVLGTIATTGDDSSPASHLHVGLRQGNVYVDPSWLVASTPQASLPEPDPPSLPGGGVQTTPGPIAAAPSARSAAPQGAQIASPATGPSSAPAAPMAAPPAVPAVNLPGAVVPAQMLADAELPAPSQLVLHARHAAAHTMPLAAPPSTVAAALSLLLGVAGLVAGERHFAVVQLVRQRCDRSVRGWG